MYIYYTYERDITRKTSADVYNNVKTYAYMLYVIKKGEGLSSVP